jgi:ABC-type transport system substrate-binding protein
MEISMKQQRLRAPIDRPTEMHALRRTLALAVCAVCLAFHGTAIAEPTPRRGGTLVFAVDAEPPNYDCHANFSFVFIHPVIPHYSTLLRFDTANYPQIVGDLAESWSVSGDKRTYTFKLRRNVLFHDGSPLTSADIKASYDRIIHPAGGRPLGAAGGLRRRHEYRHAGPAHRGVSPAVAGCSHVGELRLPLELHL